MAPWLDTDIGSVGVQGSASKSDGTLTVQGSGSDINGNADSFHFVYQPFTFSSGNGYIIAHVVNLQNTNAWAKAGVMIRETLTDTSRYAMMEITPGNSAAFQRRANVGGNTIRIVDSGGSSAPIWVKVVKSGKTFTGYKSSDGVNWTQVASSDIIMSNTVYIGLAVNSKNNAVLCTAVLDNVSFVSN